MNTHLRICILLIIFILCSCSGAETENYDFFTDKKPQDVTERIILDITPVDSLNITKAFNGSSLSRIKLNNASIFGKVDDQIVRLNKQDLSTDTTVNIPEGRGPGEIINFNVASFDVTNKTVTIYDDRAKKTALYDLDGNFQEEFLNGDYQVFSMSMADEQTYYFSVSFGLEYLFYEVRRNKNESIVSRRFQRQSDEIPLLAYGGEIAYNDNSLYFGGYSEPLIRRYDITPDSAKLVFSRAVIDDFDGDKNYVKPEPGQQFTVYRYTEEAQVASRDITVDDNHLYSVRHHNDKVGYKYLDIYSAEDGDYVGSFDLRHYPLEIAVDEDYIYTIESEDDVRFLIKYEKPEMDF